MLSGFQHMRVRTRIYLGFGLLLALALAVAALAVDRLNAVGASITRMNTVEANAAKIDAAVAGLEDMRRSTLRFKSGADQGAIGTLKDGMQAALNVLQEAAADPMAPPDRRAIYQALVQGVNRYHDQFDHLVTLQQQAKENQDKAFALGPQTAAATTALLAASRTTASPQIIDAAVDLDRSVLLFRIASLRFTMLVNAESMAAMKSASAEVEASLRRLEQVADPPTAELAGELRAAFSPYSDAIERFATGTLAGDQLHDKAMVPAMSDMQDALGKAKTGLHGFFLATKNSSDSTIADAVWMQGGFAAVALLAGLALAITIGRGIVRPMTAMTGVMTNLAQGDTAVSVPAREAANEIGDMARAVEVFKQNMIRAAGLAAEQARDQAAKAERQHHVSEIIAGFDASVRSLLDSLAAAAGDMHEAASALTRTAGETNQQAEQVAGSAEQASANVQTVAAATEEMVASAAEITRQVARSTEIAARAVEVARGTDAQVHSLAETAVKIQAVVELINGIAGQTNLLALNATIEAARAGEAGKGFAVVASEVKSLAGQTARATGDIGAQVQAIQAATQDAVQAIKTISGTIDEMNEISTAVAAAMHQQGATTAEMARNNHQAAAGTQQVSATIRSVSQGASATGEAASRALSAATELGARTRTLRSEVGMFLDRMRAA